MHPTVVKKASNLEKQIGFNLKRTTIIKIAVKGAKLVNQVEFL